MGFVSPAEIQQILELIDDLGWSREQVRIPLKRGTSAPTKGTNGIWTIVVPETDFENWLGTLRGRLLGEGS